MGLTWLLPVTVLGVTYHNRRTALAQQPMWLLPVTIAGETYRNKRPALRLTPLHQQVRIY
jgi:hypothetical protein